MTRVADIVAAIEALAPASLQEPWDNTGLLIGSMDQPCRGVLLCVDITPAIVDEAIAAGLDMIVSHHPLIFKGLKRLNGDGRVELSAIKAIRAGIAVYCGHTSVDKALAGGVSWVMARRLGVAGCAVLSPAGSVEPGLGVVGDLDSPLTPRELAERVKAAFSSPVARCTDPVAAPRSITRVAMCGGSGSEFIDDAIAAGAQAFITSDTRYHLFSDYADKIFLVDIGHFESEECTKEIFYHAISEKIPNFAIRYSVTETNPISYI